MNAKYADVVSLDETLSYIASVPSRIATTTATETEEA